MSSNFLADIAEDYKQLYETRENYDVIICAGEKPNAEEIHAHSLVLRTRSAYFRGALASSWAAKDKDSGCFIFNKPNISPSVFEFILNDPTNVSNARLGRISSSYYSYAMYCHNSHGPNFGNGDLHFNGNYVYLNGNGYYPNIGISNGLQIEDYEVFQVIKKDVDTQNQDGETILELLFASDDYVLQYFSENKRSFLEQNPHDGHEMEESEIWKQLIKWGITQNTELKDDVTEFK
ncbi:btb/poz domain-containing protein 19-like [Gigaspora margarita]|uniref:Btb/poz domain-containing protein 19-like n=1 Tax=Gigaspora margarita TaxID=4874 RepID=A0A8H3XFS4_GIGMA|nr:btb/poz domain-containing protein 19-like [Gigaspora margarita]